MQTDEGRSVGSIVKVAIHGFFDVGSQFIKCIGFSMNSDADGRGGISAVDFIFPNIEDNLAHVRKILALDRRINAFSKCPAV
jgi:hypothetical protein